MKHKLCKMVKTGYGLGLLSLAQAKKIACQIKRDLHLDDQESLRLAKELMASSGKATREVLRTVDKQLSEALVKSGLVKKSGLNKAKKSLRSKIKSSIRRYRKSRR